MPAAALGVAGDLLALVASDDLAGGGGGRSRSPRAAGLVAFPEALAEAERGATGPSRAGCGRLKQPRPLTFPGSADGAWRFRIVLGRPARSRSARACCSLASCCSARAWSPARACSAAAIWASSSAFCSLWSRAASWRIRLTCRSAAWRARSSSARADSAASLARAASCVAVLTRDSAWPAWRSASPRSCCAAATCSWAARWAWKPVPARPRCPARRQPWPPPPRPAAHRPAAPPSGPPRHQPRFADGAARQRGETATPRSPDGPDATARSLRHHAGPASGAAGRWSALYAGPGTTWLAERCAGWSGSSAAGSVCARGYLSPGRHCSTPVESRMHARLQARAARPALA